MSGCRDVSHHLSPSVPKWCPALQMFFLSCFPLLSFNVPSGVRLSGCLALLDSLHLFPFVSRLWLIPQSRKLSSWVQVSISRSREVVSRLFSPSDMYAHSCLPLCLPLCLSLCLPCLPLCVSHCLPCPHYCVSHLVSHCVPQFLALPAGSWALEPCHLVVFQLSPNFQLYQLCSNCLPDVFQLSPNCILLAAQLSPSCRTDVVSQLSSTCLPDVVS